MDQLLASFALVTALAVAVHVNARLTGSGKGVNTCARGTVRNAIAPTTGRVHGILTFKKRRIACANILTRAPKDTLGNARRKIYLFTLM